MPQHRPDIISDGINILFKDVYWYQSYHQLVEKGGVWWVKFEGNPTFGNFFSQECQPILIPRTYYEKVPEKCVFFGRIVVQNPDKETFVSSTPKQPIKDAPRDLCRNGFHGWADHYLWTTLSRNDEMNRRNEQVQRGAEHLIQSLLHESIKRTAATSY